MALLTLSATLSPNFYAVATYDVIEKGNVILVKIEFQQLRHDVRDSKLKLKN